MIHWGWLILAVMLSASFGAFIMAQFAANGQADRCDECPHNAKKLMQMYENCVAYRIGSEFMAAMDMRGAERNPAPGVGDWTDGLGGGLRDLGNVVLQRCDPNLSDLAEEHNLED